MLHEFLLTNEKEILALTEKKTLDLADEGPSSVQLKKGLPIFYRQLLTVLRLEEEKHAKLVPDKRAMAQAANAGDEPAIAAARGRPHEEALAKSAGAHGVELLRLGYSLSHVVHAYGAMCQSITELAVKKNLAISASEFHDLNQCLDVAIAGAVTEYEDQRDTSKLDLEVERLGSFAHELRNALNTVVMAFDLIKEGTVTARGNTGQVLERGLKRLNHLIDRSITEARLKVAPTLIAESVYLQQLVDQIAITAKIEALAKKQTLEIRIDPELVVEADQQLLHSALSNLIQNAIKYSREGGKIEVRGKLVGENVIIEVEDECGGLAPNAEKELFKPFEQQNENREGLGLGLTITQRAIALNHGTIKVESLPQKGCVFTITLPSKV